MNSWLSSTMAEQLGWVFVHSIWQGCLIAIVLYLLLHVLRQSSAGIRYSLTLAALLLMVAAPVATWMTIDQPAVQGEDGATVAVFSPGEAALDRMDAPAPVPDGASWYADAPPLTASPSAHTGTALDVRAALPWIGTAWAGGMIFFLIRFAGGWYLARRLRHRHIWEPSADLLRAWEVLAQDLGISRRVEFRLSARVDTPMTMGWWRPVILLPVSAVSGLPPRQLRAVIVHELAHIRRHDYVVNVLQGLVEVVFFYHPAAWWISKQVRQEREYCCDDIASREAGPLVFGRALAGLDDLRKGGTPRPALTATEGNLVRRIRRVLLPTSSAGAVGSRLWPVVFVVLAAVSLMASTAVSSDGSKAPIIGTSDSEDGPPHLEQLRHRQPAPEHKQVSEPQEPLASDTTEQQTDSDRQLDIEVRMRSDTPAWPESFDDELNGPAPIEGELPTFPTPDTSHLDIYPPVFFFSPGDTVVVDIPRHPFIFNPGDTVATAIPRPDRLVGGYPFRGHLAIGDTIDLPWPPMFSPEGRQQLEEEMQALRKQMDELAQEMAEKRRELFEFQRELREEQMQAWRERAEEHRARAREQAEKARRQAPEALRNGARVLRSQVEVLGSEIDELRQLREEQELTSEEERRLQMLVQRRESVLESARNLEQRAAEMERQIGDPDGGN